MVLVKVEELGIGQKVEVVLEVDIVRLYFLAGRNLVEIGEILRDIGGSSPAAVARHGGNKGESSVRLDERLIGSQSAVVGGGGVRSATDDEAALTPSLCSAIGGRGVPVFFRP